MIPVSNDKFSSYFLSNSEMFLSPEEVLEKFDEYMKYLEDNKLQEAKLIGSEGEIAKLDKMRIPTIQGFAYFLRTSTPKLESYRNKGGFWTEAFDIINDAMYAVSIEGAAAGLLKESIVTRKLGLAEKVEKSSTQRKVVVIHAPDNQRAVKARLDFHSQGRLSPGSDLIDEADLVE